MGTGRVVVIVVAAALLSAGLLAWVSRAPAQLRDASVTEGSYDPALGARFSDEEVARHGAYRGPAYLFLLLSTALTVLVLVLMSRGPVARFTERVAGLPGGWVTRTLLVVALVTMAVWLATLPLSFVRGYAMETAWGLSTQNAGGWVSDQIRSTLVGVALGAVAALAFFGTVRWQPRWWWAIAGVVFTGLTIALTLLWPVLIAPLFNRFTPLEDASLRQRAFALAAEASIDIDEVLVADASRRTATENAYVAGLGATKRLVLYDNLVAKDDEDAAAFVIAHELGHRVERHIAKQTAVAAAGLLGAFLLLRVLAGWRPLWEWGGAESVADPRSIPLLMLFTIVLSLAVGPVENALSRHFEREADALAVRLTGDRDSAVRTFRRLAYSNLADLRPHPVAVTLLFTHPPIPERIGSALSQGAESP